MLTKRGWSAPLLALAVAAGTCFAQSSESPKYYKLDFVVKEVEGGKVLSARSYSMTVSTDATNLGSIRAGSKVPTPTGGSGSQFTFIDVGVNIDCRSIKEVQGDLALNVSVDISSMIQEPTTPGYPVIRQNKWTSNVIVPVKKPTVLFSSDDATTKRQMQLELTATPIG